MEPDDLLRQRVLEADPSKLKKGLEAHPSELNLHYEQEAKSDNHNLKREVKECFRKSIPKIVCVGLISLALLTVMFFVMLGRFLAGSLWDDYEAQSTLLLGVSTHVGTFVFGTLATVIFKNKN